VTRCCEQDEVNQESGLDEVDGMKKGANSAVNMMKMYASSSSTWTVFMPHSLCAVFVRPSMVSCSHCGNDDTIVTWNASMRYKPDDLEVLHQSGLIYST